MGEHPQTPRVLVRIKWASAYRLPARACTAFPPPPVPQWPVGKSPTVCAPPGPGFPPSPGTARVPVTLGTRPAPQTPNSSHWPLSAPSSQGCTSPASPRVCISCKKCLCWGVCWTRGVGQGHLFHSSPQTLPPLATTCLFSVFMNLFFCSICSFFRRFYI